MLMGMEFLLGWSNVLKRGSGCASLNTLKSTDFVLEKHDWYIIWYKV